MGIDHVRISILVDNRVNAGLIKEHGFSVWIEVSGYRILFDTGQGTSLMPNAALLGCDLHLAEALVLSHGHHDHAGSVSNVLKHNPAMKVSLIRFWKHA